MAYSPIGANNGAGDDRALFEKKMETDVLKYFQNTNIVKEKVTNKSINAGKSDSFPIAGNATAEEIANDASELDIRSIKATERTIVIGAMTVAHSWLTDLDSAMVHYDAKSAHIESIGRALATKVDKRVIQELIAAGDIVDSTAAGVYGLLAFSDDIYTAITEIALADVLEGGKVYIAASSAMTERTTKDVVGEPMFLFRPAQYFSLLNNPAQTGLTWVNDPYTQSGKVPMLLGAPVFMSPNFPALTGVGGVAAVGDTLGVLFSKEAVGVLELLAVNVRVDYVPIRVSNLITGKMALGYGVLNHACAINIKVKA